MSSPQDKKPKIVLTKEECEKFFLKRTNPKSGRNIQRNGKLYTAIYKSCSPQFSPCEVFDRVRSRNPETGKLFRTKGALYKKWEKKCGSQHEASKEHCANLGKVYRKAYVSKSGKHIAASCVERKGKSPKKDKKSSPIRSPISGRALVCNKGERYRAAYKRISPSGKTIFVKAACVKDKAKSPKAKKAVRSPKAKKAVKSPSKARRGRSPTNAATKKILDKIRTGRKSPSRKVRQVALACNKDEIRRSAYVRKTKDGKIVRVSAACVAKKAKAKSPKARKAVRSPKAKKVVKSPRKVERSPSKKVVMAKVGSPRSAKACKDGQVFRKAYDKKTKSGKVVHVKGKCIKKAMRKPKAKSPKAKVASPRPASAYPMKRDSRPYSFLF